ncbi:NAD-dependent epimerase/dehydratase family protein [Bacillus sp. CHD6a]|uniref:NAD-dependent epimerase/dehydratase family protein n=1 Tax=Bacillus sp. CHD6a TaxID=1643452 RepID=UPI0006CD30D5|nr:NAD-dependent epimerase/dehydratase family protein [Bacillus sp. CHD6a]KPB04275.1 NAD-dependent dehydratase [Bacillus sp. CHD6a]
MKILVIGGTRFLGRFIIEEALKQGHEVTMFNRGNHLDLFPQVECIVGDRNKDLSLLEAGKWDVAIDTCGFTPKALAESTKVLADKVEHYTFISSISVYKDWIPANIKEDYPIQFLTEKEIEEIGYGTQEQINAHYGALKAESERAAEENMPNKVLHVRSGLLVGPYDYSDRFSYWVNRVAEGGEVLAPGRKEREIQYIDARDMALWILKMADEKITGTFNVTGPTTPATMEDYLSTCKKVSVSDANFIWAEESFLLEQQVAPWTEMPLWIPEEHPLVEGSEPWRGASSINMEKALEHRLEVRPLEETVRDVLDFELSRREEERKAGIHKEKEQNVLNAWKTRA